MKVVHGVLWVALVLLASTVHGSRPTRPAERVSNGAMHGLAIVDYFENLYNKAKHYLDELLSPLPTEPKDNDPRGDLWALLIAGSAGYGNYRHQADVAHSYHVLHNGGVTDDHIVVMVYDDIAHSPANPHPGTIRNHPQGQDLYAGLPKDYTRNEVNVKNFLGVLRGDEDGVSKGPHASGKVIKATKDDRIFVFYSDHGAPGLLGMPTGEFLYADQLHEAIAYRHKTHGFKEMVLYIEACESGSMFEGLLEDDMNVYATTASNGMESSWGVYCPGMDPSPPPEYMTCLGDLYSVSWMEDAESNNVALESLHEQFERVKQRTSNNFTFVQGSHVMEYGELEIDNEPVSWYLGFPDAGDGMQKKRASFHGHTVYNQRDADLLPLIVAAQATTTQATSSPVLFAAQEALDRELHHRKTIDMNVAQVVTTIISSQTNTYEAEFVLTQPIPPPQTSGTNTNRPHALVSDWNCLRSMINTWESTCGALGQYGMKHSRAFANLCNLGYTSHDIHTAAAPICT